MEIRSFGNYRTEFDPTATANWYQTSERWNCSCGHCRNFLKWAERKQLPEFMLSLLSKLRIPPEKATYVGELFTDDAGIHYQVSYRLAGTITEVPAHSEYDQRTDYRCCHEPYPYGAPNFPEPHFDLEFYVTLPWFPNES